MITRLIVGLGNHPPQYHNTKHNAGFMVVDKLHQELKLQPFQHKFDAEVVQFKYHDEDVLLVKPSTLMNLSGVSVSQILRFFKISLQSCLLICDDVDTPIGSLRIRTNGSSGGQKGIQNIIDTLGTDSFLRIKIGIGRPANANINLADYVLSSFAEEDKLLVDKAIMNATHIILDWMNGVSIDSLMNTYNRK